MTERRFRVGDGPEYVADVPDGTYSTCAIHVTTEGVEPILHLHPVGGLPFTVLLVPAIRIETRRAKTPKAVEREA